MNEKFQQHVQAIKRRWPAIGEHLDHPLAEWYFEKRENQPRPGLMHTLMNKLLGALMPAIFLIFLIVDDTHRSRALIFWIMMIIFGISYFTPSTGRKSINPVLFFHPKSNLWLRDIWLCGATYSELLAVEIMLGIRPYTRLRFWLDASVLVTVLLAAVAFIARKDWLTPWTLIFVFSVWILLIAIYRATGNSSTTALAAIAHFSDAVEQRYNQAEATMSSLARGCLWFVAFFGGFILLLGGFCSLFAALGEDRLPLLFILLSIVCLAGSGFIFKYAHSVQPRLVSNKFSTRCERGQKIFPEIIYRESELSDVK